MNDCINEKLSGNTTQAVKNNRATIYFIDDADTLNNLLVFCLEEFPIALSKFLRATTLLDAAKINLKNKQQIYIVTSYLRAI
jgi:hypothetical protein